MAANMNDYAVNDGCVAELVKIDVDPNQYDELYWDATYLRWALEFINNYHIGAASKLIPLGSVFRSSMVQVVLGNVTEPLARWAKKGQIADLVSRYDGLYGSLDADLVKPSSSDIGWPSTVGRARGYLNDQVGFQVAVKTRKALVGGKLMGGDARSVQKALQRPTTRMLEQLKSDDSIPSDLVAWLMTNNESLFGSADLRQCTAMAFDLAAEVEKLTSIAAYMSLGDVAQEIRNAVIVELVNYLDADAHAANAAFARYYLLTPRGRRAGLVAAMNGSGASLVALAGTTWTTMATLDDELEQMKYVGTLILQASTISGLDDVAQNDVLEMLRTIGGHLRIALQDNISLNVPLDEAGTPAARKIAAQSTLDSLQADVISSCSTVLEAKARQNLGCMPLVDVTGPMALLKSKSRSTTENRLWWLHTFGTFPLELQDQLLSLGSLTTDVGTDVDVFEAAYRVAAGTTDSMRTAKDLWAAHATDLATISGYRALEAANEADWVSRDTMDSGLAKLYHCMAAVPPDHRAVLLADTRFGMAKTVLAGVFPAGRHAHFISSFGGMTLSFNNMRTVAMVPVNLPIPKYVQYPKAWSEGMLVELTEGSWSAGMDLTTLDLGGGYGGLMKSDVPALDGQALMRLALAMQENEALDSPWVAWPVGLKSTIQLAIDKHDDLVKTIKLSWSAGYLDETAVHSIFDILYGVPFAHPSAAPLEVLYQKARSRMLADERGLLDHVVLDPFSTTGPEMDEYLARLEVLFAMVKADPSKLTSFATEIGAVFAALAQRRTEFASARRDIADVGTGIASAVVGMAITVGTGGAGAPLAASLMVAGMGAGLAALATRLTVEGYQQVTVREGAYDFGKGALEGAVDAATGGVLHGGGAMLARHGAAIVMSEAAGVGAKRIGTVLQKTGNLASRATDYDAVVHKIARSAALGIIDGVLGGSAGAVVETAFDENTYRQSIYRTGMAMLWRMTWMGGLGAAFGGIGAFAAELAPIVGDAAKAYRLAAFAKTSGTENVVRRSSKKQLDAILDAFDAGDETTMRGFINGANFSTEDGIALINKLLARMDAEKVGLDTAVLELTKLRTVLGSLGVDALGTTTKIGYDPLSGVPQRIRGQVRISCADPDVDSPIFNIMLRPDADVPVLREEVAHILDMKYGTDTKKWWRWLTEERLATWDEFSLDEQLQAWEAYLELELRNHQYIIDEYTGLTEITPSQQRALDNALELKDLREVELDAVKDGRAALALDDSESSQAAVRSTVAGRTYVLDDVPRLTSSDYVFEGFEMHILGEFVETGHKGKILTGGMHVEKGYRALVAAHPHVDTVTSRPPLVAGWDAALDRETLPIAVETLENGVRRVFLPRNLTNSSGWSTPVHAADGQGITEHLFRWAGFDHEDAAVVAATRKLNGKLKHIMVPYICKTLFPDDWDRLKVIKAAYWVMMNPDTTTINGPSKIFHGTYEGVKLVVVRRDDKMRSCYPSFTQ